MRVHWVCVCSSSIYALVIRVIVRAERIGQGRAAKTGRWIGLRRSPKKEPTHFHTDRSASFFLFFSTPCFDGGVFQIWFESRVRNGRRAETEPGPPRQGEEVHLLWSRLDRSTDRPTYPDPYVVIVARPPQPRRPILLNKSIQPLQITTTSSGPPDRIDARETATAAAATRSGPRTRAATSCRRTRNSPTPAHRHHTPTHPT